MCKVLIYILLLISIKLSETHFPGEENDHGYICRLWHLSLRVFLFVCLHHRHIHFSHTTSIREALKCAGASQPFISNTHVIDFSGRRKFMLILRCFWIAGSVQHPKGRHFLFIKTNMLQICDLHSNNKQYLNLNAFKL